MMWDGIYLDYAATTPVDQRVLEAMLPYFRETFGNPSSIHRWGQKSEAAVEQARNKIAQLMGCSASEILFTSCGSESDNFALRGVAYHALKSRGARHILIPPVEHHAVLRTAQDLAENHGFDLEYLPIDPFGSVSAEDLESRIRSDTAIVSIMYANNEIGTINPIQELAAICRAKNVPFHTDAVQAASQLSIDVKSLDVDLMSIGAHKFYGPKGVGALYVRSGVDLLSIQTGGSQEAALRAGTHNVPLIVGMAKALEITVMDREVFNQHYQHLRDQIFSFVQRHIPDVHISGHPQMRLPNHASFVFKGIDGNQLLIALDIAGIGCSSGSACKTGNPEPSDVLKAIGIEDEWALGSLRVTVGRQTTQGDIDTFLEVLPDIILKLRRTHG
ncbi:MAG: cysteine desulfurase NifS [Chloroflexi bacterium RBG_16_48_8]|nr:MAG: cysteine desulfurase NifS [Chloroflexi bacterium RBG_16_48_8]